MRDLAPSPIRPSAAPHHVATALAVVCLTLLPFAVVHQPPITDLPQQSAQIRLLLEHFALGDASPYRVQAWHPNKLGYLPIALGWMVAPPLDAGRIGMALAVVAGTAAIFVLARRRRRPAVAAAVAALFVFNHALYWGFVNFVVGLPLFLIWIAVLHRPATPRRDLLRTLFLALLLYSSHVLWLAAALLWLVGEAKLDIWAHRRSATRRRALLRRLIRRLAAAVPALLLVALWFPSFAAGGVDARSFEGRPPWERLDPTWLAGTAFGGLRGPQEKILLVLVLLWILLGIRQSRRTLGRDGDPRLLLGGGAFALAALLLPEVHRHTIFFAGRWMPVALMLLCLGAPPPRLGRSRPGVVAALLWIALSVLTVRAWRDFERLELRGLRQAVEQLPDAPRVLGLDFVRQSPRILGFPYYHLYADAQVLRGGELNRSFAEEASSLVVYRHLPRETPWTPGLDWKPRLLRHSDLEHFDYLLVHAESAAQAPFAADPKLEALSEESAWRLYRLR